MIKVLWTFCFKFFNYLFLAVLGLHCYAQPLLELRRAGATLY